MENNDKNQFYKNKPKNKQTNSTEPKPTINQTLSNLNKTTKVLILFLYTLVLVLSTAFITQAINKGKYNRIYKNYVEVSEDENIYVTIRLDENRTMRSEKEAAYYDFYIMVFVKPLAVEEKRQVEQVKAEYDLSTQNGEMLFREYDKPLNPSSNKCIFSMSSSPRKSISDNIDQAPDTLYLKITYKVSSEGQNTKQDKQLLIKEKIENVSPNTKAYEQVTPDANGMIDKTLLSYTLTKSSTGTFKIQLKAKENNQIKHISLHSYLSIDNEPSDTEDFFNEYLMLVNYYGTLNMSNLGSFLTDKVDAKYNPKFVYVKAELEKYDGNHEEILFKVDVNNVPVK